MDESLEIPVTYNGEELCFPAKIMSAYTLKFQVDVNGHQVLFEPDEERNYRALLDPADLDKGAKVDIGLLKAIAEVLESVMK